MEQMKLETKNITDENIKKILELFPNVATEALCEDGTLRTAIDFEKLKQELSEVVIDGEECYDFTWVGKNEAMLEANRPIRKTLRPDRESSVNWENTENIYIEGDNLDALKLLQESYLGKIKMIYIDPPYNTGKDFIYNDNYTKSREDYEDELGVEDADGNKLFKNTDTNGRFHSSWCTSIYPTIKLASNLLKKEGGIFISIDENEVNNLKKICDEVFGEQNHVLQVAVNRPSEIASNNTISKHEYLLVYCKDKDSFIVDGIPKYTISRGTIGNADQTEPTILFPKGLSCRNIPDGIYNETRKVAGSSENIYNESPIIVKNGVLYEDVKLKAKWRSSNDMRNFFNNDCKPTQAKINGIIEEIYFENDRFNPQIKKKTFEKIPSMILDNKRGSTNLEKLDMSNCFSFPKSVSYLKQILSYLNIQNDEIVLDFFSGSATTAQAAMELNVENNGNCKFIMVQINENLDETLKKTENTEQNAIKSAIKFLDKIGKNHFYTELGKERIRRAGNNIQKENPDKKIDVGFRVFKVDTTNMKDVYYTPSELKQGQLNYLETNIKDDRTDEDLLYGCLLDWGVELSLPHRVEIIDGKRVHIVDEDTLIACFEENIPESVIRKIADMKPLRVVFRDSSFSNDDNKINVEEIFKLITPDTRVKVI